LANSHFTCYLVCLCASFLVVLRDKIGDLLPGDQLFYYIFGDRGGLGYRHHGVHVGNGVVFHQRGGEPVEYISYSSFWLRAYEKNSSVSIVRYAHNHDSNRGGIAVNGSNMKVRAERIRSARCGELKASDGCVHVPVSMWNNCEHTASEVAVGVRYSLQWEAFYFCIVAPCVLLVVSMILSLALVKKHIPVIGTAPFWMPLLIVWLIGDILPLPWPSRSPTIIMGVSACYSPVYSDWWGPAIFVNRTDGTAVIQVSAFSTQNEGVNYGRSSDEFVCFDTASMSFCVCDTTGCITFIAMNTIWELRASSNEWEPESSSSSQGIIAPTFLCRDRSVSAVRFVHCNDLNDLSPGTVHVPTGFDLSAVSNYEFGPDDGIASLQAV